MKGRIITSLAMHHSSETQVITPMLNQSACLSSAHAKELILFAGFFDDEVIEAILESDMSLFCPEGQWLAQS